MTATVETLRADFEAAVDAYTIAMPNPHYWRAITQAEWCALPVVPLSRTGNPAGWNACVLAARKLFGGAL